MPRREKVSRQMKCTIASVLFMDLKENKPVQKTTIIPGVLTEVQAAKRISEKYTNEFLKFVTIKEMRYNRCCFTMDLIDFIKVAIVHELKED